MRKKIIIIFFIAGFLLLCINITGFFIPLRSPDISQLNNTQFGININEQQVFDVVENTSIDRESYIINVNDAIHSGVAHYWEDDGIDHYHLRVPIYENYILFYASYVWSDKYKKYEFVYNYRKAIERGVGLCSQKSIIVYELLERNNIDSKIIGLGGHVVVSVLANPKNDEWWVLDPDYGVIIQHNIHEIEKNPKIIWNDYSKKGYSNETIYQLEKIFGNSDNAIYETSDYYSEMISYLLIWLIPLCCMLPFSINLIQIYRLHKKR